MSVINPALDATVAMPEADKKLLDQLGLLALCRRGMPAYYQALVREDDEILRTAAIVALLELQAVWSDQAELVLANCHHGAVKRRAFPFFQSVFEYGLAERCAHTAAEDVDGLLTSRMEAELALDYERMTGLDVQLFLAHGTPDYLWTAEVNAERYGGWRSAVPIIAKTLLARPMDATGPFHLLSILRNANQTTLVEKVCASFETSQVYKTETAVFRAALCADRGDNKEALKRLERIAPTTINERLNAFILRLRGEVLESQADYGNSYAAYQRLNTVGKPTNIDPKAFYKGVEQRNAWSFSEKDSDGRLASYLMMVGFPRSGTTLLENALAVHPRLETFEETNAFSRMARWLERFAPRDGQIGPELAQTARDKYFDEIERQRKKTGDIVRIDKMPLSSSDAVFLKNIMPSLQYIFSIRHPYDVVLSCFRQSFLPNAAMENFRTLAGTAAMYDFTMSQWFSVHSLEGDPDVVYVRYEDLVQNFRPTLEGVLDFIGVGWDDAVLNFVEAADKRFAKTPSYKKVRSGLSIGVQSSRENYKFLFETKETAVLKKWVKHFGYDE